MKIEPFKYLLQPVAIERDEDGKVKREIPGETISVYSVEQAVEAIMKFEKQLEGLVEASQNGTGRRDEIVEPDAASRGADQ